MIAKARKPGNFVIVRVGEKGERMPLTIADANLERGSITLVVQVMGVSSRKLCALEAGDYITDLVGPLRKPTHIEKVGTVLACGGGVGVAPLLPIVRAFKEAGNRVISVIAGRNKDLVILEDEIRASSDEVMFDTEKVFIKAWDYAGEKIGIGKAGYMVYKTLGMSIVASYEIWNEEFGDRYNQEELRKYTKEFLKNYYENNKVPVKQGLYVLLEYLKNPNAKLAVASSSPRWEVEKHLNDAGIIDCFSAIICGDMVEKSKPAPDIYIKACEMLNENPEECIALEDSKNGLLSAYRAGCKPIMVPDLWQPDEEILQIIKGKYSDLEQVKKAFESGEI